MQMIILMKHFLKEKLNSVIDIEFIVENEDKTILINDDRGKIMRTNTEKISAKVVAAIVATGLMSFCGVIVETSMNVTFPILMREFSITTNQVQWMTSIYLLLVATIVPLSAILKSSIIILNINGNAIPVPIP